MKYISKIKAGPKQKPMKKEKEKLRRGKGKRKKKRRKSRRKRRKKVNIKMTEKKKGKTIYPSTERTAKLPSDPWQPPVLSLPP